MRTHNRGQALPEFALILPLMLLMAIGVVDFGRVLWALDSVSNAAREGARYAIVHGNSPGNPCPLGPGTGTPACDTVQAVAISKAVGAGGNVTATVCYGPIGGSPPCVGNVSAPGASSDRGTPVTVRVQAQLNLISSGLLGMNSFTVEGNSTMLVNN
jgi:Flp pilus assembly protein TadG